MGEFLESGVPSKHYRMIFSGIGEKEVLAVSGIGQGLVYEGIFLRIDLNGKNPFTFEDHSVFIDGNFDVWLGIPNEN
jgi:hypothetical protein